MHFYTLFMINPIIGLMKYNIDMSNLKEGDESKINKILIKR